jgi:hypothetical protein
MVFTIEHNTLIVIRSGLQNENGHWLYSQQSVYEQFVETCPEEQIEDPNFAQHWGRFVSTGNVVKGKSTGRPTVATPDVVQNIEEIVEEHPHFSIRRLSQQIGSH